MKNQKPLRVMIVLIIINIFISTYLFSKTTVLEIGKTNVSEGKDNFYEAKKIANQEQKKQITKEEVQEKIKEATFKIKEKITEIQIEIIKKEEELQKTLKDPIVYDGLTMQQLSEKLDKSLYSNLSGYGNTFANLSIKYNMDPYLVVAIVLQETGCKWGCSYLVKNCNNIGGMKGNPTCAGSYRSFKTLDIGIQKYVENLYYNYYEIGLTTPEAMNSKYAESTDWAEYVNKYIEEIKAK